MPEAWIIVGASRGIGLEFVRQLAESGQRTIAAVRDKSRVEQLDEVVKQYAGNGGDLITVEECDVASEKSIEVGPVRIRGTDSFTSAIKKRVLEDRLQVKNVILNAGINHYPNRATEISFSSFTLHITTNTIGPIITAQKLLAIDPASPPPEKLVFISSDSGSTALFRGHEDGFGIYAATKAALNQALRHMAAEIERNGGKGTCVLALHPGEVETDMANVELGWQVEGVIQPRESVEGMLRVIAEKGAEDNGTFWRWDGRSHPW
ncbi:hypothetical protein BJY01DRAFT_250613 [Aspergillus pseudoustus]|uniref:NAD(P)-binding protein n=1 Tax=Aspergillus pseudoustus TaxID=1810923 RepID=A0ABR4JGM6_9EURO